MKLGLLCEKGHDWQGTGQSRRFLVNGSCADCGNEKSIAKNATPEGREYQRNWKKLRYDSDPAWVKSVQARQATYVQTRKEKDPAYRTRICLRARVNQAIKDQTGGRVRRSRDQVIDYQAIIEHLGPCPGVQARFGPEAYHVDHIRPLSSFDLTDPEQFAQATAPNNHQWLPAEDNIRKSNRTS